MKIKEIEELFTEAQKHRVIAHQSVLQCLIHGPELVKRVRDQQKEIKHLYRTLKQVRRDINWMLNNNKLLNPEVFDYLHKTLDD